MQDRFDEGRRVLERSLADGRKIVDRGVHDGFRIVDLGLHDGRKLFDRSLDEGRKLAGRTYDDGRKLADRGYAEGRKAAGRAYDDSRTAAGRTYDDSRKMAATRLEEGRRAITGESSGPGVGAVLWPTVLLAAGAAGAFWWWTQWSRGKAESEATAHVKPEGGQGAHVDHPEMVMAHNAAPKPQGAEPVDASDAKLVEPAEQLMQHVPIDLASPQGDASGKAVLADQKPAKAAGKSSALGSVASAALAGAPESLNASLAVQGAASGPKVPKPTKAGSNNGATPDGVKSDTPHAPRKGPTVM